MRKAMRARSKLADLLPSYAIQAMQLKPEAVCALLKELLGTIPDCIRVGTSGEVEDGSGQHNDLRIIGSRFILDLKLQPDS